MSGEKVLRLGLSGGIGAAYLSVRTQARAFYNFQRPVTPIARDILFIHDLFRVIISILFTAAAALRRCSGRGRDLCVFGSNRKRIHEPGRGSAPNALTLASTSSRPAGVSCTQDARRSSSAVAMATRPARLSAAHSRLARD